MDGDHPVRRMMGSQLWESTSLSHSLIRCVGAISEGGDVFFNLQHTSKGAFFPNRFSLIHS